MVLGGVAVLMSLTCRQVISPGSICASARVRNGQSGVTDRVEVDLRSIEVEVKSSAHRSRFEGISNRGEGCID